MNKPHIFQARVYYENTDAGGVVYHADYLNFAARARTEFLRTYEGVTETIFAQHQNVLFVVREATIQFKSAARLDDLLTVKTTLKNRTPFRILFEQHIFNEQRLCVTLLVEVVCVHKETYKPVKIPTQFLRLDGKGKWKEAHPK